MMANGTLAVGKIPEWHAGGDVPLRIRRGSGQVMFSEGTPSHPPVLLFRKLIRLPAMEKWWRHRLQYPFLKASD